MAANPDDIQHAAALGNFTAGQIDPAVSDDAKMIANAIVYAGGEITRAVERLAQDAERAIDNMK